MMSCLGGLGTPSDQLNLGMGGKVELGALSSCKHFSIGAVQGPTAAPGNTPVSPAGVGMHTCLTDWRDRRVSKASIGK